MGLDTSHDAWHGPYSAFSRWRTALMEAAGWKTEVIREPDGMTWTGSPSINWDAITHENILGEWERLPEDPLVVLIAHSDCDGVIPTDALIPLAERLEGLAARMDDAQGRHPEWAPDKDWARATYDGEQAATLRFAAGCRLAAAAGEPVEFH